MDIERIPDECLPFNGDEQKLLDALRGPKMNAEGRYIDGVYQGMTHAEVLASRDAFNRAVGE